MLAAVHVCGGATIWTRSASACSLTCGWKILSNDKDCADHAKKDLPKGDVDGAGLARALEALTSDEEGYRDTFVTIALRDVVNDVAPFPSIGLVLLGLAIGAVAGAAGGWLVTRSVLLQSARDQAEDASDLAPALPSDGAH